jgi:hypothetical protein
MRRNPMMDTMWSYLVVFPDDNPASPMDAGVPIFRGPRGFQPIEFTDIF